jgi:hypothetical protein
LFSCWSCSWYSSSSWILLWTWSLWSWSWSRSSSSLWSLYWFLCFALGIITYKNYARFLHHVFSCLPWHVLSSTVCTNVMTLCVNMVVRNRTHCHVMRSIDLRNKALHFYYVCVMWSIDQTPITSFDHFSHTNVITLCVYMVLSNRAHCHVMRSSDHRYKALSSHYVCVMWSIDHTPITSFDHLSHTKMCP